MATTGIVRFEDTHIVAQFVYDQAAVTDIRRIPGSRFDRTTKCWRLPLTATDAARSFAARHGLTDDLDLGIHQPADTATPDRATHDDRWIHLHFAYDAVKVRAVKQLPSVTWDRTTTAWRVPVAAARPAVDFADRFQIPVSAALRDHVARADAAAEDAIAASRATDAELDVAGLPLLPYQRAGVAYATTKRRVLFGDDMGLGKTLQAIATLEALDAYPAVVVCPPTLVLNWANEYRRWLPDRTVATITNRKTFPDGQPDVIVVGWSNLAHWADRLAGRHGYVFDESHYAKSYDAQRTKAALKLTKKLPAQVPVLCLTGTPVTNRPAEFAPQLEILGVLDKFGGKWGFFRYFCAAFRDRFGQWHLEGAAHLDELHDLLRATCMVRRTKEQVLTELPPVRHHPVLIEGDPKAMAEYRKAEADIVNWFAEEAKRIAKELGVSPGAAAVRARMAAEANEHLVRLAVLRRLAAKAKLPFVIELVAEHVAAGRKVVLAAHHRDVVDELAARFGGLKIQGGQDVAEIEAHKSRFQSEPVGTAPAIVLSMQAAKTGHTLTASQDVIFVELPWTPADVDQTYSRCHRLGQQGSVTTTYVLVADTIDEKIHGLIDAKRAVVSAAVDGGEPVRDVDVAAELILSFL